MHFCRACIDRGTARRDGRRDRRDARRPRRLAARGRDAAPARSCRAPASRRTSADDARAGRPRCCGSRRCRTVRSRRGAARSSRRSGRTRTTRRWWPCEEALARLYPGRPPLRPAHEGDDRERRPASTAAALAARHARHVHARARWLVACVGDVEPARALDEAERVVRRLGAAAGEPAAAPSRRRRPAGRRRAVCRDDEQGAGGRRVRRSRRIARSDPSYDAFVDPEQRARAVRAGRAAGRQHPRARGDGLLRLQRASTPSVGEAPLVVRAGVSPANVEPDDRVDRRRAAADGARRRDAARAERVAHATSSRRCRGRSRPTPESRRSCRPASSSASDSTTTCRLPARLDAVTLDQVNDLARRFLDPGQARRSPWRARKGRRPDPVPPINQLNQ